MKKTYKNKLPKGMKPEKVTARIEDGNVIVEVELKEEFSPKDGDILVSKSGSIFIYCDETANKENYYSCYYGLYSNRQGMNCSKSHEWTKKEGCRYATNEEKAYFTSLLEERCKMKWNHKKKCLESTRIYPKDGDFLVDKDGDIFIYNGKETEFSYGCYICESNKVVCIESADNWVGKEGCMYASEKEKNEFLARLEEQYNVRWNQEKKETEKIRWRAGIGEKYYFISDSLKVISDADLYTSEDDNRYKVCNYFKKRESAIIISEKIKEILRNSESE